MISSKLQSSTLAVALCSSVDTMFEKHKKVSFNIASEASYLHILNGQKLIKNAKNGAFWRVFENLKLAVKQSYQTCQFLIGQKLVEMAKMRHFEEYFQWGCFARNVVKRDIFEIFFNTVTILNLHKLKLGSVGIFSNYCGSLIHTWWSCFWPCFDSLDTKLNDSPGHWGLKNVHISHLNH